MFYKCICNIVQATAFVLHISESAVKLNHHFSRLKKKTGKILLDSSHQGYKHFDLLASSWCFSTMSPKHPEQFFSFSPRGCITRPFLVLYSYCGIHCKVTSYSNGFLFIQSLLAFIIAHAHSCTYLQTCLLSFSLIVSSYILILYVIIIIIHWADITLWPPS